MLFQVFPTPLSRTNRSHRGVSFNLRGIVLTEGESFNLRLIVPHWEFVKVYTDEGISGLNTKKRDGFNEMITDALDGRIDLIVTKSVSRFARNTVDSLTTIRKLKDVGCEVYFEKENIWTFGRLVSARNKIMLLFDFSKAENWKTKKVEKS